MSVVSAKTNAGNPTCTGRRGGTRGFSGRPVGVLRRSSAAEFSNRTG